MNNGCPTRLLGSWWKQLFRSAVAHRSRLSWWYDSYTLSYIKRLPLPLHDQSLQKFKLPFCILRIIMAAPCLTLKYTVLDVFTKNPWSQGNPLAVVQLTKDAAEHITQDQKQLIAREFNFSETTFLHDYADADSTVAAKTKFDIFTKTVEVAFAGHPTIGTATFCFNHVFERNSEKGTLVAKAGEITVRRDRESGLVGADVPCHNYRVHSRGPGRLEKKAVIQQFPMLQRVSDSLDSHFQLISIAKGL